MTPEADLEAKVRRLEEENGHLRIALESRVVIEQAKGVLAARLDLTPDQAFAVLRRASRNERKEIHEIAQRCIDERGTPNVVIAALDGDAPK